MSSDWFIRDRYKLNNSVQNVSQSSVEESGIMDNFYAILHERVFKFTANLMVTSFVVSVDGVYLKIRYWKQKIIAL